MPPPTCERLREEEKALEDLISTKQSMLSRDVWPVVLVHPGLSDPVSCASVRFPSEGEVKDVCLLTGVEMCLMRAVLRPNSLSHPWMVLF